MPEMAVSDRFILAERFVRLDAPADSTFAGFWVEVRQNLTNGERKVLIERLDEIAQAVAETSGPLITESNAQAERVRGGELSGPEAAAAIQRINAITTQLTDATATAHLNAMALILPHIRDWNVYQPGEDGEPVKAEPPATAGLSAMDAITDEMGEWLKVQVLSAYRSGKGVTKRSTPPGASGLPTGGPKVAQSKARKARIPASQTSSPGHSASMYQA